MTCLTHLTFNDSPLGYSHWLPTVDSWFANLFPPWPDATWIDCALDWLCLPYLLVCLLEGAWYVYFHWFKFWFQLLPVYLFYHYMTAGSYLHQAFSKDVRLRMPSLSIMCDVTLFGRHALPQYTTRRTSSLRHHQFGIRLRMRYKLIPVRV